MDCKIINKIKEHIKNKENFLLSGGAGSGKTYTLMQVLDLIYEKNPLSTVACITYTNIAVDEIKNRSPYDNLKVSTIHDFLWSSIKDYQKNLKISIVNLLNQEKQKEGTGIKYSGNLDLNLNFYSNKQIEYKEYKNLEEGIISHDDVLKIANYMFKTYPLLNDILKDKYNYILIDEYQDTEKQVIDIFLNYLQQKSNKKNIIGLFGDSMQSIYDKGIGNIKSYIDNGLVKEVIKEDNYRCSKSVIELLNKIRTDIKQEPAGENKYLKGTIKFIYSNSNNIDMNKLKQNNCFDLWDFSDTENTKELYLTNKLIAKEFGFYEILNTYPNNDRLIGDNKDRLIKHLFKIEDIIYLYENKKYNDFIKKTQFKIKNLTDKSELKSKIELLVNAYNQNIENIISLADKIDLIKIDDNLNNFINEKSDLYEKVKILPYSQIINLYNYEQGNSPYSTQHGVKGAEFNNVFIILDNGRWNNYNFNYLFEETPNKEKIIDRTRKIFYVCCSRSKDKLIVFFHKPSAKVLLKANELFGKENIIKL